MPFGMWQQDLQGQEESGPTPGCHSKQCWAHPAQIEPQGDSTGQGHIGLRLGCRARLCAAYKSLGHGPSTGGSSGIQASGLPGD